MSYTVEQTRRFARQYKKLHNNVATDVDVAVELVAAQPSVGERKKGDLADLFVYKFRSQGQLYLLGYTLDEDVRLVYLEAIGPHENFYRDLKH
ncbi:MAG TPA: addiction module toxin RelE [Gallionella sp.]|jgi:mRNA-degrading endonuclease RelE of RelBE toxin-antitoxin system|nr:type II toxin-antitoxin system RelE/ParE family toxin [Gallionella sp.]OGS68652.1 MAG: addiction module toxin RelE [Gallionellales bacterium GWA2_54_124]OGT19734.1 MAG: addiction module toxin RelE [Gallionellales bacterium RIFOXYD12_FULL_53_10]OGT27764.1 MAG: addiction module toxin RelE [Gallionellales bacterium RIFOXYD2_FULL_52_7]MDP1595212.1 type II toxin-antitoxin system RelE/ParE family toxin [Gallionella sp.]